jgi:hypothetical protein
MLVGLCYHSLNAGISYCVTNSERNQADQYVLHKLSLYSKDECKMYNRVLTCFHLVLL